ncbi:MAG: bifunctional folylpolyglutamate synthase/dihydrofolate synthase [Planctomycetes bacterium]|nr:bifunctional folylpolyglutamate synthase/dihydrofolate synthase [Planctomycetota bacterium]
MNYLRSLSNHEHTPPVAYNKRTFKLDRMKRILTALGHPEKAFKTVHIAGTKGKGCTSTMVACMLQNCGYKVGLYTSPHLTTVRERMTVNAEMLTEQAFTKVLAKAAAACEKVTGKSEEFTYFELLTAAAFLWFAESEVEVAVVETGLGGRLDSTNVIKPEVCGITNISYDHTAQLGTELAQIAAEKAGIFKKGVPVVSAPQKAEAMDVLRQAAADLDAPFCVPGEDNEFSYRFEATRLRGPHTRLSLTTPRSRFEHLPVPLPGEHQAINCSVALSMMDALKSRGFRIDDQRAIEGLGNVHMQGRMEMVREEPRTLIDGAHNAASVEALMRAIGQAVPYDSMIVIFACQRDKDIAGMLRHVQLGADKIIFTSSRTKRSADPRELLHMFQESCTKMAQVADDLQEALSIAERAVSRDDLICITGSFYIVGDARRMFSDNLTT